MQVSNFQCSMDTKQTIDLLTLFNKFTEINPVVEYKPAGVNVTLRKLTLQKARFKPLAEFSPNYGVKRNTNAPAQSLSVVVDVNVYRANITLWKSGKIVMIGSVISKNINIGTSADNVRNDINKVPSILQNYMTQAMTPAQKKKVMSSRYTYNNLTGMFTFNKNPDFIGKKPPTKDTFFQACSYKTHT